MEPEEWAEAIPGNGMNIQGVPPGHEEELSSFSEELSSSSD